MQIAEYPSPVSESKLNLTNYPVTYEAQVQAYILKYLLLLNLQLAKNLSSAYKNRTRTYVNIGQPQIIANYWPISG